MLELRPGTWPAADHQALSLQVSHEQGSLAALSSLLGDCENTPEASDRAAAAVTTSNPPPRAPPVQAVVAPPPPADFAVQI